MPDQGLISRFIGRLRFPQLFFLAAILLGVDLIVPDVIPFLDEALLALLTAMLAATRPRGAAGADREERHPALAPRA